jgi:tetratricopeptide (TPR) repeat protein
VGLAAVTTIGVFSKENAVAILGVLVLYEITWWDKEQRVRRLLYGCAAVLPPLLAILWARASVLAASRPAQFAFVENPMQGAHFVTARLTALAVMARYLWRLAWPLTLSGDYSYSQIPLASGNLRDWTAWIAVAIVAAVTVSQFRKNRLFFFFGAFAFVTFVPVANLLFLTGTIMAERFLYLPAVGFAGCVTIALYAAGDRFGIRVFAPAVLCLFIAGFGVRTWVRNLDWRDELTMATASVRTSPNSCKTHLGLALALTESDPSRSNIYQVIEEMEKSMAIVDSLPDSLNTSIIYAKAGSDYVAKGDRFVQRDENGRPIVSSASRQAYERSLQILTRGVGVDKASEPAYRERLRASGRYAAIPVGLPQLYAQLGVTYMRLGNFQQAYDAANFAHLLDPSILEPYVVMGQSLANLGRKEEAAAALVEGTLVSGQRNLFGMLNALYRSGVDTQGCAITRSGNSANLNNSCAVVHSETCQAWADLSQIYDQNERTDLAEQARSKAVENFGCSADLRR